MAAGCARARYRDLRLGRHVPLALMLAALFVPPILFSSGRIVVVAQQRVAALSPAWSGFQAECVGGASPGQGFPPRACVCWERNLEAVGIYPSDAVENFNAALADGNGVRQMADENGVDIAIRDAIGGCRP